MSAPHIKPSLTWHPKNKTLTLPPHKAWQTLKNFGYPNFYKACKISDIISFQTPPDDDTMLLADLPRCKTDSKPPPADGQPVHIFGMDACQTSATKLPAHPAGAAHSG